MRVLVCGGRDYSNFTKVMLELTPLISKDHGGKYDHLIVGSRKGADGLALKVSEAFAIPATIYWADWIGHGKSAGPKRNQRMLDEGKPDLVVAFEGGRGTADMVRRAKKAGVKAIEIK